MLKEIILLFLNFTFFKLVIGKLKLISILEKIEMNHQYETWLVNTINFNEFMLRYRNDNENLYEKKLNPIAKT
jgi:hypothetical protein